MLRINFVIINFEIIKNVPDPCRQMKYHPLPSHRKKTNSRIFTSLLAASTVQSRQFFESTLPEQKFELKSEDAVQKTENLCDTCAC